MNVEAAKTKSGPAKLTNLGEKTMLVMLGKAKASGVRMEKRCNCGQLWSPVVTQGAAPNCSTDQTFIHRSWVAHTPRHVLFSHSGVRRMPWNSIKLFLQCLQTFCPRFYATIPRLLNHSPLVRAQLQV